VQPSSASRWPRSRAAAAAVRNDDRVTLGTGQGQSADPVAVDYPIFYVKRPVRRADCANPTEQRTAEPGIRHTAPICTCASSASLSALETNLTKDITKKPWRRP